MSNMVPIEGGVNCQVMMLLPTLQLYPADSLTYDGSRSHQQECNWL